MSYWYKRVALLCRSVKRDSLLLLRNLMFMLEWWMSFTSPYEASLSVLTLLSQTPNVRLFIYTAPLTSHLALIWPHNELDQLFDTKVHSIYYCCISFPLYSHWQYSVIRKMQKATVQYLSFLTIFPKYLLLTASGDRTLYETHLSVEPNDNCSQIFIKLLFLYPFGFMIWLRKVQASEGSRHYS